MYVLQNHRRHHTGPGRPSPFDPFSTARYFDGFTVAPHWPRSGFVPPEEPPVAAAKTWLLRAGWRRLGLLRPQEAPARDRSQLEQGSHVRVDVRSGYAAARCRAAFRARRGARAITARESSHASHGAPIAPTASRAPLGSPQSFGRRRWAPGSLLVHVVNHEKAAGSSLLYGHDWVEASQEPKPIWSRLVRGAPRSLTAYGRERSKASQEPLIECADCRETTAVCAVRCSRVASRDAHPPTKRRRGQHRQLPPPFEHRRCSGRSYSVCT